MKLAVISAKFPYGGHEPYLHTELRALAPHFDAITVFPTSPDQDQWGFRDVAANVRHLGVLSGRTVAGAAFAVFTRPRQTFCAVLSLLLAPTTLRVKVKNMAVVPLGLAVGAALRRGGFDHVHSYWLSTPATVAYLAAQVAGIPWSSTGHLWDIYENNALRLKLASALFVRAISERGKMDILGIVGDRSNASIEVVHVGVDVAEAPLPERAFHPERAFELLCAANLVVKKGHADLFRALALVRSRGTSITCTIAGDGILRSELQRLASELDLTPIIAFRGNVEHATLLEELRCGRYDAMVLASRELAGGVMEGIPVTLMEAMAAGVPVISTHTGSIPELIDEECGRLVPQADSRALALAIEELACDAALRNRLACAAHQRVDMNFNVLRIAKTLTRLVGAAPANQT